eukprot:1928838-Rhodomonas_salina.2
MSASRMHLRTYATTSPLRMVAVPRKTKTKAKVEIKRESCCTDRKPKCAPDPEVRQEYFGAAIGDTVTVNWVAKTQDGDCWETVAHSGASGVGSMIGGAKTLPARLIKDEFCLGGNDVHTSIHTACIGMLPGDQREVTLPAEDCFGEHDPDLVYTVTKDMLRPAVPADMPVPLGTTFKINRGMAARVTEVDGPYVVLDANVEHAGKDFKFSLTMMDVHGNKCSNGIAELDFLCDF